MKTIETIIICIAITAAFFLSRECAGQTVTHTATRTDTLFVRDTVRDTVLVPNVRLSVRTDTVWMNAPGDTVRVAVEVPVEQKIYETADYRAVVEGFRPALVGMEIYRNTALITKATTLPGEILSRRRRSDRWGIGIQAGYGLNPHGPAPYIGVGVQYNVITW